MYAKKWDMARWTYFHIIIFFFFSYRFSIFHIELKVNQNMIQLNNWYNWKFLFITIIISYEMKCHFQRFGCLINLEFILIAKMNQILYILSNEIYDDIQIYYQFNFVVTPRRCTKFMHVNAQNLTIF